MSIVVTVAVFVLYIVPVYKRISKFYNAFVLVFL